MKKFEVGKQYGALDSAVPWITIIRRTEKTVWVEDDCSCWSMRIKGNENGEYVTDSSVPSAWQECYTYYAEYEREGQQ